MSDDRDLHMDVISAIRSGAPGGAYKLKHKQTGEEHTVLILFGDAPSGGYFFYPVGRLFSKDEIGDAADLYDLSVVGDGVRPMTDEEVAFEVAINKNGGTYGNS